MKQVLLETVISWAVSRWHNELSTLRRRPLKKPYVVRFYIDVLEGSVRTVYWLRQFYIFEWGVVDAEVLEAQWMSGSCEIKCPCFVWCRGINCKSNGWTEERTEKWWCLLGSCCRTEEADGMDKGWCLLPVACWAPTAEQRRLVTGCVGQERTMTRRAVD